MISGVIALFVVVISLRGIAGFYTDFLWFQSVGQDDVFVGILGAKVALFAIFTMAFFVLLMINLVVADRIAPPFRPAGPEEEVLERYYEVVGQRKGLVRLVIALVFALIAGAGVSDQWNEWILFTHGEDFGTVDPLFNRDIGFYLFKLPFLSFVVSWAFAAFVIIFIVTAVAHYLNGGIRLQTAGERVTPLVKAHLSVLLAVLALVKAADYYLARFELTVSGRGTVDGATSTDVNAQLPAYNLLILISLFAVVLLLVNIRRRGWTLPVLAVGLWALVNVLASNAYPAFVQQFQVEPAESSKEEEFISRNIEATRAGFGLDDIEVRPLNPSTSLNSTQIDEYRDSLHNVRILDPFIVQDTFERLQAEREFYQFNSRLDIDRYTIDGETTPVVIGARELDPVDGDGWENSRVTFTHGYGLAIAAANETDTAGEPRFTVGGVPIEVDEDRLEVNIDQPRLYYGELPDGYAIVGAAKDETDFVVTGGSGTDGTVTFRYDGAGGVGIGSFIRQAAFALRFNEVEPLISDLVTSESKVIFRRTVAERVRAVAPFLELDSDAYPVVLDGRVVYVLDGYTTSSRYPYSQGADVRDLTSGSDLRRGFNYVRNSVKAVVDAYDGSIELYVMPGDDPIINAYRSAFSGLFSDFDDMPAELKEHLRYPQDLFRVQTNMWSTYHVDAANTFYARSQAWSVAQDPESETLEQTQNAETGEVSRRETRIAPQYQLLRLPGDDDTSFVSLRPYVPESTDDGRKELISFMTADSDPEDYGKLTVFEMSSLDVDGPSIVASNINTNREITSLLTLLNQQGSTVRFGDLLLLPIDDSIVYARSLFLEAEGNSPIPRMQGAIVVQGERIELAPTFEEALSNLLDIDVSSVFTQQTGPGRGNSAVDSEGISTTDPGVDPDIELSGLEEILARIIELQAEQGDTNAEIADLLQQFADEAGLQIVPETTVAPKTTTPSTTAPTTTEEN